MEKWVRQLDSPRFEVREAASRQLIDAGPPAVQWIVAGISHHGVEASHRGLEVLRQLALQDTTGAMLAEGALAELADPRATAVSMRAAEVLDSLRSARTARAIKILRRLGAAISFSGIDFEERSLGSGMIFITLGSGWKGTPEDIGLLDWLGDYKGINVTLQGPEFDETWLTKLADVQAVVGLQLNRNRIGDEGLRQLTGMANLVRISIRYCRLSDACLKTIEQIDNGKLQFVSIYGSGVSKAAFDELTQKHPDWNTRYGRGGFLGIRGGSHEQNGRPIGCMVHAVQPNHAANIAGIREFDIITKFNGQRVTEFIPQERSMLNPAGPRIINGPIQDPEEEEQPASLTLSELIGENAPGDRVTVTILRNGRELEKEVVLGEWP